MKATFLLASSQITISTKIPGSFLSPRDLGAHQLVTLTLHGLWQCGRGEYFLPESLVRSYKYENGGQIYTTNFQCQLAFPSVQAVTITWFQSLLQQVFHDMKKGFRATLEMEARIQDTLVF